jgi:hypothetical protein
MAEKAISPYDQGHIIVAAVRLFMHREEKMPTAPDIAHLTGFPMDLTLHLTNKLLDLGILKSVKGAFEDRYHVGDHLKIEDLPRALDEEAMGKEVEKFKVERLEKKKKIEEMFLGKEIDQKKKDRMKSIEEQLKDPAARKRPNPLDALTRREDEDKEPG